VVGKPASPPASKARESLPTRGATLPQQQWPHPAEAPNEAVFHWLSWKLLPTYIQHRNTRKQEPLCLVLIPQLFVLSGSRPQRLHCLLHARHPAAHLGLVLLQHSTAASSEGLCSCSFLEDLHSALTNLKVIQQD